VQQGLSQYVHAGVVNDLSTLKIANRARAHRTLTSLDSFVPLPASVDKNGGNKGGWVDEMAGKDDEGPKVVPQSQGDPSAGTAPKLTVEADKVQETLQWLGPQYHNNPLLNLGLVDVGLQYVKNADGPVVSLKDMDVSSGSSNGGGSGGSRTVDTRV